MTYFQSGGGRDLEALESFERAVFIVKEEDRGYDGQLAVVYQGIGLVHARLGNWDESIDFLYLAHSKSCATDTKAMKMDSRFHATLCEEIGRVCLDQYFGMNDCFTIHRNGRMS